jgi:hypothetical protein
MENFKLSLTDSTTWTGQDALDFYSKALLSAPSVGYFNLIANNKSIIKIANFELGNVLQDADCTFTSNGGEGTLSQTSVEVTPLKINLQYCKRTFETNFLSQTLRSKDDVLGGIETYLLDRVGKAVSADIEKLIYQGNTAGTASYPMNLMDGFEKKFEADSNVIKLTATASLSATNVITELKRVYDAIPPELTGVEGLAILVSSDVFRYYRQALANSSPEVNFMQQYAELHFLDIPVKLAPGASAKKIFAGILSRDFIFSTDLMSDMEDISVLPLAKVTGAPVINVVGELKAGVAYVNATQIVFYR